MRGDLTFACNKPGRKPGGHRPAEMDNYYVLFYTLCLDAIKTLKADIPFVVNFSQNRIRVVRRQDVYNAAKWLSQDWPFEVKQTHPLVQDLLLSREVTRKAVRKDFRRLSQQEFFEKYRPKLEVSRDLVLLNHGDYYFTVPQSVNKSPVVYKSKDSRLKEKRVRTKKQGVGR